MPPKRQAPVAIASCSRTALDGVVSAFETARARGVRVAVGPLVRDDLKTLLLSGARLPWTVALNQRTGP